MLFLLLPLEEGAVGRGPGRRSSFLRGNFGVGVEEDDRSAGPAALAGIIF